MTTALHILEAVGEWMAMLMMRYPEQACCIMSLFLIGIVIHASCKIVTR